MIHLHSPLLKWRSEDPQSSLESLVWQRVTLSGGTISMCGKISRYLEYEMSRLLLLFIINYEIWGDVASVFSSGCWCVTDFQDVSLKAWNEPKWPTFPQALLSSSVFLSNGKNRKKLSGKKISRENWLLSINLWSITLNWEIVWEIYYRKIKNLVFQGNLVKDWLCLNEMLNVKDNAWGISIAFIFEKLVKTINLHGGDL